MKRILVLALVVVMALGACARAEEVTSRAGEFAGVTDGLVNMEKTLDVTWWGFNIQGYIPMRSEAQATLEELFNIRITNVEVDNYNSEQVNLMLATGIAFDISTSYNLATLHDLGLIRPVEEDTIATLAPFFVNALEAFAGDAWKLYSTFDGQLYGIPELSVGNYTASGLYIRTDWLEAAGYGEGNLPKTLEEMEALLLTFVNGDPDGNGVADTHALDKFNDYRSYVLGAYDVSPRYWYPDEEGNPNYYAIDENYREALKTMQRWYKLGIFDPEIVTDGRPETTAKYLANKLAGYDGTDWANTKGHNISPVFHALQQGLELPATMVGPVAADGYEGLASSWGTLISQGGICFGLNCTDEKIERLLQMQNTVMENEALYKYLMFGPEGVVYVNNADGSVSTTTQYNNESMHYYGSQRFLCFNFMSDGNFRFNLPADRYANHMKMREWPRVQAHAVSAFRTEADITYSAATGKVADEFFLKALVGDIDIDTQWAQYVQTWLAAGGQEMIDAKMALWHSMQ